MIFFIRSYQFIASPFLGSRCRFYPSCSEYAVTAFQKRGFFYGFYLTAKRLFRCHPAHPGGVDYVD